MIETIGVLGGGAWGTALALSAARAGRKVRLWARDHATVTAIDETHENPRHLPGIKLDHIPATTSIAVALRADAIILAVPAQARPRRGGDRRALSRPPACRWSSPPRDWSGGPESG